MAKRVSETWMRWVPVIVVAAGVIAAWGRFDVRVGALEGYRIDHTVFVDRTLTDVLGRIEAASNKAATDRDAIRVDMNEIKVGQAKLQTDVSWLVESRKAEMKMPAAGGAMVGMPPVPCDE